MLEQFAGNRPWDYFLTITAELERTAKSWRRGMVAFTGGRYIGDYEIRRSYWGLEQHKSGRLHAHALVQVTDGIGAEIEGSYKETIATQMWQHLFNRFGRSEVVPFDPSKGACYYVSKYCVKGQMSGILDWDINIR